MLHAARTRYRVVLSVLSLLAVCSACTTQLSDTEAERIAAEARSLLADHPSSGPLDSAKLPPSIAALRPKLVYVKPDGLYIQASTWFTREHGLYVPRDTNFSPSVGGDPHYERIRAGLYRYRIAG